MVTNGLNFPGQEPPGTNKTSQCSCASFGNRIDCQSRRTGSNMSRAGSCARSSHGRSSISANVAFPPQTITREIPCFWGSPARSNSTRCVMPPPRRRLEASIPTSINASFPVPPDVPPSIPRCPQTVLVETIHKLLLLFVGYRIEVTTNRTYRGVPTRHVAGR